MNRTATPDIRIILNIIIAVIIGFVFGSFIRNSMLNYESIYASAYNYDDTIYLLQSGIYYDETNAHTALNELNQLGINGVIVKEHDRFYLYHQIATSLSDLTPLIKRLDELKINYFVKERILLDMISQFDEETDEYEFYNQSINYFLTLLHLEPITFTDDYINSVSEVNLELYYNLSALNQSYQTSLAPTYNLYVYKSLVDLLL